MIGTTLNQRFTLDEELGWSDMGVVYRATDTVLRRTVAIKVLRERTDDQVGRKLHLEAQILARLVHDHIVRLYDFGVADGTNYFVMEVVDGLSFARRWRQIPLIDRLRVLAQTADALDYAHRQGVIHRDIKPANVLLTATGQAKLSDFGISLIGDEAEATGTIQGTPHYMSPEQARGRRLDHRTDLYGLGVMLYECVTGALPFQGPTMAVIARHVGEAPDPPRSRDPAISSAMNALILRLIEKDPERRPSSGAEVASAIRELIASDPMLRDPASTTASGGPTATATAAPASTIGPGTGSRTLPPANGGPAVAPADAPAAAPAPTIRDRAMSMIADVVAVPIALSAADRYFCGHYLAYLLGGSRRLGFLRRRPLDPLNADRARLMLAMTWMMLRGPADGVVEAATELLESRFDVRPALSPVVVAKYLAARDSPNKRKAFRQARMRLQEASPSAGPRMTDENGVLNPGLMPQRMKDLAKVSPAQVEVDDQLVGRWNRVAEVWRARSDFRLAVLGYATTTAWRDPVSVELWPEVVYPLLERARWQRQLRSAAEAAWDNVCGALRLPDAGLRLDRAIVKVVPSHVLSELDLAHVVFEEDPRLDVDLVEEAEGRPRRVAIGMGASSLHELADDLGHSKTFVRLAGAGPVRLTMGHLRELYQEAVAAVKAPGSKAGHRHLPIGPYRLAVVPSTRGRSAGQIAIQGMPNKQIEMLIPSIRLASSTGRPILAVWPYEDDSLAIAYVDYRGYERFISWHAPTKQQDNYDDAGALNSALLHLALETPDQLDKALSKRFRPRKTV